MKAQETEAERIIKLFWTCVNLAAPAVPQDCVKLAGGHQTSGGFHRSAAQRGGGGARATCRAVRRLRRNPYAMDCVGEPSEGDVAAGAASGPSSLLPRHLRLAALRVKLQGMLGTGSRRVTAARPQRPRAPPPPLAPLALCRRELEGGLRREARWCGFSSFQLLREWECFTNEGTHQPWWPPFHLRRRLSIVEVIAAQGILLVLSRSGVCAAFDQGGREGGRMRGGCGAPASRQPDRCRRMCHPPLLDAALPALLSAISPAFIAWAPCLQTAAGRSAS